MSPREENLSLVLSVHVSLCSSVCPERTLGKPCPRTAPLKADSPYPGGQLHTVVEIPKPEEVGEAVSDVKRA